MFVASGSKAGTFEKGNPMSNDTQTTHTVLRAEGFSCPSCVAKVEKQVGRMDGVTGVQVHFASGRIEVDHDASKAPVEDLIAVVGKAGYRSAPSAF